MLHLLLVCTDGAALFTAFLKKEFSHENIEFWTEVENYKKSKPSRLTSKARKIFEEYIAVKAAKEVSGSSCAPSFQKSPAAAVGSRVA